VDGKPTTRRKTRNKLGTARDQRVKVLETLAGIILGSNPERAFENREVVDGKRVIVPTSEEAERIDIALSILRNQGLGKESELTLKAREMWNSIVENHLSRLASEISAYLEERQERFSKGNPEADHPSIMSGCPSRSCRARTRRHFPMSGK